MTDKEFEALLTDVMREYGASCVDFPEEKYNRPHEFSQCFEKKMQRLIRRERSFCYPLVKTPVRRLVTIAVTVVIALSVLTMSVGALRNAFAHFFADAFETHTAVKSAETDGAPTDFRDVYEPTEIPDEFDLVQKSDPATETAYLSLLYKNGDCYIGFHQWLKSEYEENVNTEQVEAQPIEINGFEGFILDWGADCLIIWDHGDYIFEIGTGGIGKDALISVAESVQKVE